MEREIPEFVFNSRGYLALSNWEERPVSKLVPLEPFLVGLLPEAVELEDVWNSERCQVGAGALNPGVMAPHSSCLLRVLGGAAAGTGRSAGGGDDEL